MEFLPFYLKNISKVVSYSSRALTETEQRYSQIERECLGAVYGCEKHRVYLLGREFTIFNDHKALYQIFNNPKCQVPLRIERMLLRLQAYDFKFLYIKGENNISDYTSRHPVEKVETTKNNVEEYVHFVSKFSAPNALSLHDIKIVTKRDELLQDLTKLIRSSEWYKLD